MKQNRQPAGSGRQRPYAAIVARGFLVLIAAAACGGAPPRTANPTRPLDERRAIQIIIQAFRNERDRPVGGRKVEIQEGKELEIDVGASGHKYGVAYVTAGERQMLGDALPRPQPGMEDALQLVRGTGEETEAKILVLHDTNYLYDDQVGINHEETVLTAERKLSRDVQDFIVRAQAEQWP
jgi:hypothetical protein